MKGIILAGGSGTRLYPITKGISKQLTPVYDKPMIYYPISVLMLAGIKEILIISTPLDQPRFEDLLGNGEQIGIRIEYAVQPSPDGLAQAFIIGETFIADDDVCLILGDNLVFGHGLRQMLINSTAVADHEKCATVFSYYVNDPERYGVVAFDNDKNVIDIEEKPKRPKSNFAVIGIYFYPNDVVQYAKGVKPSARGELEITSINQRYLQESRLKVEVMGRGFAWLDMGTHESLLDASNYIHTIEKRQGLKVACLEEIAFLKGYIDKDQLLKLAEPLKKNQYGQYLLKRADRGIYYVDGMPT